MFHVLLLEEQTSGEVLLSTGTLYGILKRLLMEGLIAESRHRPVQGDDQRRRYYRLTDEGRRTAVAEAQGMERLVSWARGKKLLKTFRPG